MAHSIFMALQAAAQVIETAPVNAPLALLILLVAALAWFGLRAFVRGLRAGKTHAAVRGNFHEFAREALINAAKLDGRVDTRERDAIVTALAEIGLALDATALESAFVQAGLGKEELIAYLRARSGTFSREQKVWLLKALLAVFVADGRFDESEHAALVDYTAAIGFDRQKAPEMLRDLSRQFLRGNIT
ncbi:MAG: TerB family tellurite resistance protein [Proteobacteria bacterium]|nr:TerB family tellurite resistance protein [Pseudomonadota bacterium]